VTPPGLRRREDYLERERDLLAPYASKAADSRGRAFPEAEHDLRSPYERDRDRIIHSSAFRKLEYKTQVFVNHEGDYYRTRLTHTLEAAQIARSAARFLRVNEDLTEAIALVHDVGHPPFGHAGEAALRGCMAAHGGFEHNLHSLRVVDELERHYPEFAGLNLTWEVREGIIKHSKAFDPQSPDPGLEEFAGAPWPSLEAQIVDICDEIAYNAHDVDDGLAAGMITLEALNEVDLWRRILDGGRDLSGEQARYYGVRALSNAQVQDLVETAAGRALEWALATPADVRTAPHPIAGLGEEMATLSAELRRFLSERVYRHYRVHRMWIKAKRVVTELFRSLEAEPGQLPPALRSHPAALQPLGDHPSRSASRSASVGPLSAPRAICDYLAGLSDREALHEHARLFDPFVSP
jgi:dGTPase